MQIDISIVTYNSSKWLVGFFESLINQFYSSKSLNVYVRDNGSTDDTVAVCEALIKKHADKFNHIEMALGENSGFGAGHNSNLRKSRADFFLVTNVDLVFEPDSILYIVKTALADDVDVASWEFRQKPFEHPKYYNPVTLETTWSSSACILFRRAALEKVGGYEERIFLYGEDVELSYRLRDNGFVLKYCPKAVCWHYSYEHKNELKPAQFFGSAVANVFIRCRYGSFLQIVVGFLLYLALFIRPVPVKHKTKLLFKNLAGIFYQTPYFLRTRKKSHAYFPIRGWDYEIVKTGAFYEYIKLDSMTRFPMVSVIIRTFHGRLEWLKQAVTSVLNQTYSTIELVVVEDGSNLAESFIDEIKKSANLTNVIYKSIPKGGRCVAGNAGLAVATGEFLVFLDDDDLFFADHIEVLADALVKNPTMGAAYSMAYQVPTKMISASPLIYREGGYTVEHQQPFCRPLLWRQNYFPIQAVLFRRSLYDIYGGFDLGLHYLEDWDLWIRFSLKDDFLLIDKLTSLYRVPRKSSALVERHKLLAGYRQKIIAKQKNYYLNQVSIAEVVNFCRTLAKFEHYSFVRFIGEKLSWLPAPVFVFIRATYKKIYKLITFKKRFLK